MVRSCFVCHVPEPKPRFKFPKDEEKLELWCNIMQCKRPKQPGCVSGEVVCSYHFNEEDIHQNEKDQRSRLKPGTLPIYKPLPTRDKKTKSSAQISSAQISSAQVSSSI